MKRLVSRMLLAMLLVNIVGVSTRAWDDFLGSAAQISTIAPGTSPAFGGERSHRVTLVTGDTVTITYFPNKQRGVSIIPSDLTSPHRNFWKVESPRGLYVFPSDVNLEKLDLELFNIDYLIQEGYDTIPQLPVMVSLSDLSYQSKLSIAEDIANVKGKIKASFHSQRTLAVELPLETLKDATRTLLARSDIAKIWLDRKAHASLSESVPLIGAPELWNMGYKGTGIEIAILDTGIDKTHPDLDDFDDNPSTPDPKVIREVDFTDDETTVDLRGHGTHVAGIAAGTGTQSGGLNKGVAPGAKLWNVKVLNRAGFGYESWVISGIEYAAYGPDGIAGTGDEADIISMSLGGSPTDGTGPLSLAVDAAADAGVVMVVAAGNEQDYFQVTDPGVARKAIAVGGSTKSDELAPFSSKGPTIDFRVKPDVLAPGLNINSTVPYSLFGTFYEAKSGTSMATPHVSGAAALMLEAKHAAPLGWSFPKYVKNALIATARDLGCNVYEQGGGRIYVPSALDTEVLVDPATVSFGLYSGNTTSDSAVITFYNLNGTSNRVLSLNATVYDVYNEVQVNYATLNATTLNIGPNSNASILLTINTTVPRSLYSGKLVAEIDTGKAVHAIFGFAKMNKVTVTKVNKAGAPASDDLIYLIGDLGFPEWQSGTLSPVFANATFYVADGTYHALSVGRDFPSNSTIFTIAENVSITSDTVINLDERDTLSIDFDENKLGQKMAEKTVNLAKKDKISLGDIWTYPSTKLSYVSPTSFDTWFTYSYYPEAYYNPSDPWLINTPEWNQLLFSLENLSGNTTFVADYSSLVQRTTDYKVAMMSDVASVAQFAADPLTWGGYWSSGWYMSVPRTRVEWLSPYPAFYFGWYARNYPLFGDWEFDFSELSYPAGTSPYRTFGEHPLTSGAFVNLVPGYLVLNGTISTDTYGDWFSNLTRISYDRISGNVVVLQDGLEVYRGDIWDVFNESVAFSGTPLFKVVIEGNTGFKLSTKTHAELTFTANATQDYRPPRLKIKPQGSDSYCRVLDGTVLVNVTVADDSPIVAAGLEYSVDGGATWIGATEVNVFGDTHQFSLGILGRNYVSLRVNATDSLGNRISQTTIRALYVMRHDVAVTNINPAKTVIGQGYVSSVGVDVENQGHFTETFNVKLYANSTAIGEQTVTNLAASAKSTLTFTWSTTDFAKGNYTLSAYVEPVLGEIDMVDNTFVGGWTKVTIPGDVDGDRDVDILDVVRITGIYGSKQGEPMFNPNSDVDNDGKITILDVVICTSHYGQKDT